jgi:hypothetical protein
LPEIGFVAQRFKPPDIDQKVREEEAEREYDSDKHRDRDNAAYQPSFPVNHHILLTCGNTGQPYEQV